MAKPKFKMKTVVAYMDACLHYTKCHECPYYESYSCQTDLLNDAYWYMSKMLEKSRERRGHVARVHQENISK